MRKKIVILLIMVLVFAISGFCAGQEEKMEIKLGTASAAKGSQEAAFAEKFIEKVAELSDGKIDVIYFPGGQLGSQRDMLQQAQLGKLEIVIAASNLLEVEPQFGVFDLPYLFRDAEHARKVLDGSIGQEMNNILKSSNLKILAYSELGFRQTSNNVRPIVEPKDFAGLMIRTPENKMRIETFRSLGASPTPLSFGELYTALQQGVIDGQENPLTTIVSMKFYEVQKYVSLTNHVYSPSYVTISLDWWNSLNDEYKAIFTQAADEAKQYAREVNERLTEELINFLKEKGVKVNEVKMEYFIEGVKPVWEQYKPIYGAELISKIEKIK